MMMLSSGVGEDWGTDKFSLDKATSAIGEGAPLNQGFYRRGCGRIVSCTKHSAIFLSESLLFDKAMQHIGGSSFFDGYPHVPAPQSPTHAIIIPHYNDVTRLLRCLEALRPQLDEATEVVVVDNASTVELTPVHEAFPEVRVIVETQKGAGPARNRGVLETTAPWILFIDSDCLPAPDWLSVGREIAKQDHVIGGRVDVFHETPAPQSGAEAFETVFAFDMRSYLETRQFLGSGNLVISRDIFDKTGGFRPAVSEDVDWSQRAAATGFTLAYEDRFACGHPSRSDWAALRHKWRRLTSEAYQLRVHTLGDKIKWAVRALAMLPSILAHVPRVMGHEGLTVTEKLRAVGTLVRVRVMRLVWMFGQLLTGRP
jgi:GT2 family glycosyltransferase